MMKQLANAILGAIISISIFGCGQNSEPKKSPDTENKSIQTLCFRNEYPYKNNPEMKDIQELNLSIEAEQVSGTYHWLPAEKDQRKGSLSGTLKGNVIEAKYVFSQEGLKDSADIIITLFEDKAIIKANNAALGLDASLKKVDCTKPETNKKNNDEASIIDSLVVYQTEDLIIQKLSDHVYEHISFLQTDNFGKVACNGMIAVSGNEAVIFDATTNKESSEALINFISKQLKLKIKALIPGHFHEDCVGGIEAFMDNNIPVFANNKTIALLKKANTVFSKTISGFDDSLSLIIGNQKIYAQHFGEGHSKDIVVGYFPEGNALFGGCLIKELGATKGNLADANVKQWPQTVLNVKERYPNAQIIIPGHGQFGGPELYDYSIQLFE